MLAEMPMRPAALPLHTVAPPVAPRGVAAGGRADNSAGGSDIVAGPAAVATAATAAGALAAASRRRARGSGAGRHSRRPRVLARAAVVEASAPPVEGSAPPAEKQKARPLQIVKIDLERNDVVLGDEEVRLVEKALADTGAEKVAIVGVMGAFRTGKSFLLDLMLRYCRENSGKASAPSAADESCEVPEWVGNKKVPSWVFKCGSALTEGRELPETAAEEAEGFLWRPGMEKCTEGIWVWSEAFTLQAGDEKVAVLLMDTQGAWDAKMTKEQSATVFGLTTLMTSRLVYNVSKQIQQDKIDNLLYFVEFAQAALRTKELRGKAAEEGERPFQTLEFLVRDWPHYDEAETVASGRNMMRAHLGQYADPKVSSDTESMDTLGKMFDNIDIWCLPHPSLKIERESWRGNLDVIEPQFWRFLDEYVEKIFSPDQLKAKTTLGSTLTVSSFGSVFREFVTAFGMAAPQAQTFAQAMETSTCLLARESAVEVLRSEMKSEMPADRALDPEVFEQKASLASAKAKEEFQNKAIFGDATGISKRAGELDSQVEQELSRFREENQRRLESQLGGLTNATLAAATAFLVDRSSDITCDWWLGACRDLSGTLQLGYVLVAGYVALSLNNISSKQGGLSATVAAIELWKGVVKRGGELIEEAQAKLEAAESSADKPDSSK